MPNIIFPVFIPSYDALKENEHMQFVISFYHHDDTSEPTIVIVNYVEDILLEHVEGHGYVISIRTPETSVVFSEKNYMTNISGDAVVFSSIHDYETYWLIEFKPYLI